MFSDYYWKVNKQNMDDFQYQRLQSSMTASQSSNLMTPGMDSIQKTLNYMALKKKTQLDNTAQ